MCSQQDTPKRYEDVNYLDLVLSNQHPTTYVPSENRTCKSNPSERGRRVPRTIYYGTMLSPCDWL